MVQRDEKYLVGYLNLTGDKLQDRRGTKTSLQAHSNSFKAYQLIENIMVV